MTALRCVAPVATPPASAPPVTKVFESLDDFTAYAAEGRYRSAGGDRWAGGSFAEALRTARDGDESLAERSEVLLRKYEERTFATSRRQWVGDVAGVVANVPGFIAGHPASMRRRTRRLSEVAPVTVFVDLFLSAHFTPADALARGAAVLALVRVLARFRAVTLYVGVASTTYNGVTMCPLVRLNTTPIDLAHVAYAMCGVSFTRRLVVSALDRMVPGSSPWPPLRGALRDVVAAALGDGAEVLVVPGAIVSTITRDPEGWIEAQLREIAPEVLGDASAAA